MNNTRTPLKFAIFALFASAPATAADKPWTALILYSEGRPFVKEDLKYERTCRELLCQMQSKMSCAEIEEAAKKRKQAEEKEAADRETKIAAYRLTHACKIIGRKTEGSAEQEMHCPLPDGGERIYDTNGKPINNWFFSGGEVRLSGAVYSGPWITKAVCFQ